MTLPRWILFIIAVAVIVRVAFLWMVLEYVGSERLVFGDGIGYVELAKNLSLGKGFQATEDGVLTPNFLRTPGLPLLMTPFVHMGGGVGAYTLFLAVTAGILVPLFVFHIARRVTNERVALVAAALSAFEPLSVLYSFLPLTEAPFTIFSLGGLLAALVAYEKRSFVLGLLAGVLFGYAALIRPAFLYVCGTIGFSVIAALIVKRDIRAAIIGITFVVAAGVLVPWYMRNHELTGVFSLSGGGWRNVYTDYVASVRSLVRGTSFGEEKEKLKEEAVTRFGILRSDVNNPKYALVLRDAALGELWEHKTTVLKLEAMLLAAFFLRDGYYFEFRRIGFFTQGDVPHISATKVFLTEGIKGFSLIIDELARQRFVPLGGRLFVLVTTILAGIGFFVIRHPLRFLFAASIVLTAVLSTVIGLGMEPRLRIPIAPFLFIFAGAGGMWLLEVFKKRYAN